MQQPPTNPDRAQIAALGAHLRRPVDMPVTLDGPLSAALTTTQAAELRRRIRETVARFLEEVDALAREATP